VYFLGQTYFGDPEVQHIDVASYSDIVPLVSAEVSSRTFRGTVMPSWAALSKRDKRQKVSKLYQRVSGPDIYGVILMDSRGNMVADARKDRVRVMD